MAVIAETPGHGRDDNMVGFIPPVPHRAMFVTMRQLGILYDSFEYGWRGRQKMRAHLPSPSRRQKLEKMNRQFFKHVFRH